MNQNPKPRKCQCEICKQTFQPRTKNQKYCSYDCRDKQHHLHGCAKSRTLLRLQEKITKTKEYKKEYKKQKKRLIQELTCLLLILITIFSIGCTTKETPPTPPTNNSEPPTITNPPTLHPIYNNNTIYFLDNYIFIITNTDTKNTRTKTIKK